MAAKRFENPLLSDARLKEMFVAMAEARALSERLRAKPRARDKGFLPGSEAVWVGTAIGIRDCEDHFVCAEEAVGPALDLVLGVTGRAALRGERSVARLEGIDLSPLQRAWFAVGAASRMRGQNKAGLLYLGVAQLDEAEWKQVLTYAQRLEVPLIFIAIPTKGDEAGVAERSSKLGLPGIPVDASDSVAMYRVAQESLGRARAGGGPALIEAVRFPRSTDPIALLRRQLLGKQVATERWLAATEHTVERRVAALRI